MNERTSSDTDLEAWRIQVEAMLRAGDRNLALIGLFWLKPGYNSAGGDGANDLVLPGGVPEHLGSFELYKGQVTFYAAPDVEVAVNGIPTEEAELHPDRAGGPDLLTVGDMILCVVERDGRFALALGMKGSHSGAP